MRCDWRHGVLVGLAMALAVPAVKPARAAPCRGTACMPADRSPLGLSYRMVAQADIYGALIGLLESQEGHADEIAALRRKIAAL